MMLVPPMVFALALLVAILHALVKDRVMGWLTERPPYIVRVDYARRGGDWTAMRFPVYCDHGIAVYGRRTCFVKNVAE